jgi:hypothetical protein
MAAPPSSGAEHSAAQPRLIYVGFMAPPRALSASVLVLFSLLFAAAVARADEPGPRPVCDVKDQRCTPCWEHYAKDAEEAARFDACAAPLRTKGLVEACRSRQGAGDKVWFCPEGVKVETKIQGGCAGCALGGEAHAAAIAALAAACAIAALRRRRGAQR